MLWFNNNLIDEKNEFLVGFDAGGECCDWAEIHVYDDLDNEITNEDLTDWEFVEFPILDVQCGEDKIVIMNSKTGEKGLVTLDSYNNGYYSACYWAREMEQENGKSWN